MKPRFHPFIQRMLFAVSLVAPSAAYSQDATPRVNSAPVVNIRAEFSVDESRQSGTLLVTATVRDGYHIYAMSQPRPFLATRIDLESSDQVESIGAFQASRPPQVHRHNSIDVELHEYEGEVTWTAPFSISADADPSSLTIAGQVFAQACYDKGCLPPETYMFTARQSSPLVFDNAAIMESTSGHSEGSSSPPPVTLPRSGARLDFDKLEAKAHSTASMPLYIVLPMAFVAGFILNFMPCVLPVIGLKVMAFAQQAGDSRRRVLMLNLWYSLGLIAVFMVLATLAAFLGFGWGQQFSSVTFTVVLAAVVFAFGLSFLGVWEIPIPGFIGAGAAHDLAQREGAAGAFSKGVLTTVLATPCSGPLLGSALTWAVMQPPLLTYMVFAFVGLGMASPYLVVGALPGLVKFLPRPGAWMITFKHFMGFILLATVAYLLSFMPIPYVVPMVTFLIALGAVCWRIGHVPPTASRAKKASTWIQAVGVVALGALVSFGWLQGVMNARFERAVDRALASRTASLNLGLTTLRENRETNELPWRMYSHELLSELTAAGKTVFVDFTADWCLTCKANEAAAINQKATIELVAFNDVVTLKADKTQAAPEVDDLLRRLGNRAGSIPFYAVFPAGNPNQPILLDGILTSPKPILDALHKAGPSRRWDVRQTMDVAPSSPTNSPRIHLLRSG